MDENKVIQECASIIARGLKVNVDNELLTFVKALIENVNNNPGDFRAFADLTPKEYSAIRRRFNLSHKEALAFFEVVKFLLSAEYEKITIPQVS
ncbi:hypothetical protein SDD30_01590 [Moorella naiadis]|uniref:hypothetical protein n=1 Tax=Moorella naiadis (nom. illeg.) TaxID=3093670 RepID=UPI003D9C9F3C